MKISSLVYKSTRTTTIFKMEACGELFKSQNGPLN